MSELKKFNGITVEEFKVLMPDYSNIEGDNLWNKMEDYALMRFKYKDAKDSRYIDYVYPIVRFEILQTSNADKYFIFYTNLRIFSKISMFYYIIPYDSNMHYDTRQPYSEHFMFDLIKQYTHKCYSEIYNILHFYLIDDNCILSHTGKQLHTFDIYQGSEYHRLKLLKDR